MNRKLVVIVEDDNNKFVSEYDVEEITHKSVDIIGTEWITVKVVPGSKIKVTKFEKENSEEKGDEENG